MSITAVSVDPALRNFGFAEWEIKIEPFSIRPVRIGLVTTSSGTTKNKVIRKNSDDLRCATELHKAFQEWCRDAAICFAEVPVGSKSSRAMLSVGLSIGILASCPVPIVQVQPHETKLATVGKKTATKDEMIAWAGRTYPDLAWRRLSRDIVKGGRLIKRAGDICDDQEHIADALAVAHAGIKTDQFQQLLSMWRATTVAAAA